MATTNVSIPVGTTYTKIAEDTDTTVLASLLPGAMDVEFAATDADVAPSASLNGHVLGKGEAMTRTAIGPGFVWARSQMGATSLIVTVDAT